MGRRRTGFTVHVKVQLPDNFVCPEPGRRSSNRTVRQRTIAIADDLTGSLLAIAPPVRARSRGEMIRENSDFRWKMPCYMSAESAAPGPWRRHPPEFSQQAVLSQRKVREGQCSILALSLISTTAEEYRGGRTSKRVGHVYVHRMEMAGHVKALSEPARDLMCRQGEPNARPRQTIHYECRS